MTVTLTGSPAPLAAAARVLVVVRVRPAAKRAGVWARVRGLFGRGRG